MVFTLYDLIMPKMESLAFFSSRGIQNNRLTNLGITSIVYWGSVKVFDDTFQYEHFTAPNS